MGMSIDNCIEYFNRSFAIDNTDDTRQHNEVLEMTISTMRKYQKIEELYDYWRSGKCEYTISCMENIGKVLKDGNDE